MAASWKVYTAIHLDPTRKLTEDLTAKRGDGYEHYEAVLKAWFQLNNSLLASPEAPSLSFTPMICQELASLLGMVQSNCKDCLQGFICTECSYMELDFEPCRTCSRPKLYYEDRGSDSRSEDDDPDIDMFLDEEEIEYIMF